MIWILNTARRYAKQLRFLGILLVASVIYTFIIALLSAPSLSQLNYYPDAVFFGVLFGLLAWATAALVFSYFSKAWARSGRAGFFTNLIVSFFITTVVLALSMWAFYGVMKGSWVIDFRAVKELMMILNFQLLVSLVYLGQAFATREVEEENQELKVENQDLTKALDQYKQRVITVTNGKTKVFEIGKVSYFRIDQGLIFAHLSDQTKYPIQETTLAQLEQKLNPKMFLRINRSEIINIQAVEGFEPYFKDRLSIKLSGCLHGLYTSNSKSSEFRQWIS